MDDSSLIPHDSFKSFGNDSNTADKVFNDDVSS